MSRGDTALTVSIAGVPKLKAELREFNKQLTDLAVFQEIAREATVLAKAFAPHRTGALAASIRASWGHNRAAVRAGSAKVQYAPIINYGSPRQHIRAQRFMQKASDVAALRAVPKVQAAVDKLVRSRGLS